MKKILLLLFIVGGMFVSSCKKVLDLTPDAVLVPENAYSSTAQINAALSGMYTNLKYVIGYSQYYSAYYTAPSDEGYFYNTTGFCTFANTASDNTTGNTNSNFWKGCYQTINYVNTFLDYVDASSAGKVDTGFVRRAKGEAYFLRGFHYFLLAQWYGDVPMSLHGVNDPTQSQIARTPVKAVYDQIITDMTKADSMLYDQTFASLGYSEKISQVGVESMLARVCLFAAGQPVNDTKRFADALAWCKKVAASKDAPALVTPYSKVFTDEEQNLYNKENIWEIGFNQKGTGTVSAGGGIGVYVGVSNTASSGTNAAGTLLYDSGYCYSYLKLHPRLYFKYGSGDARRDWNVSNYSYTNSIKVPLANNKYWSRQPAKWRREYEPQVSRSVQMTSGTNFPVIRFADVLLMMAEAENEVNGPTATAYGAINQVRERSISTTKVIDSISSVTGTGYTSAPTAVVSGGSGSGIAFNIVYTATAKTVQVLLTGQGSYSAVPTITIGNQWAAATAYTVGMQVATGGRLYTVTTAGTSTATAPTNTSGASAAATTGAVFTYAGVAVTAVPILSGTPVVDLTPGLSQSQFRQAIQDERSRELCFEALRLQDLKRWGILQTTIKSLADDINGTSAAYPKIPSIVSENGAGTDAVPLTPVNNISAKDMFWPIPQYDLNLNKLLTQNPGY